MALSFTPALRGPSINQDSAKEADLVRELAGDSPDALAALYRLHGGILLRLACRLTSSRQDAEDALHDLFVGLPEAIRKFEGRGSLEGWLKRVLVRLVLMRQRAQRRRREVAFDDQTPDRAASRATDESGTLDLERVLAELPDDLRAVLVLRETEGYSHKEIGVMLGITPGASRVRLSRAIKLLRAGLRGRT
jgi:RNA polymerase sigma-70 factor (ECF subfamily)